MQAAFPDLSLVDAAPKGELPSYSSYRALLQYGSQSIYEKFKAGAPASTLIAMRSQLVDATIIHIWQRLVDEYLHPHIALIAVGGYGRRELLPHSDIDLLILVDQNDNTEINETISKLVTFLWDIGLQVGHSVRTIPECVTEAIADVTVITNIMESRQLAGSPSLYENMLDATASEKIWAPQAFFSAKIDEQKKRYAKFNNSAYRLEPNIKESPGGLRDIQTIAWIVKRYFGALDLRELVEHDFITAEEFSTLTKGQEHLWKIRYVLHHLTGREEDRLLFNLQRDIADTLGFTGGGNEAVEQFMQSYYRTIMEIERLNEMLIQLFQEALLFQQTPEKIVEFIPHFRTRNNYIEAAHDETFNEYPPALIKIFLVIAKNPEIEGVRAHTIRLIRESLPLIDDHFRNDVRVTTMFMELLRQPHGLTHQLRRMNRYGVLAAYLPAFQNIVGRMQYDLFHVYTVDEHILMVLSHMRRFAVDAYKQELPLCSHIMAYIPRKDILYLACIFHDIAKGRKGDHSTLGAEDVKTFGKQHGLSSDDTHLISWLVKNHLLMSLTAQSKDISDPAVINQFALTVGSIKYLQHLYLLTCADIQGTNPTLWTSWKDNLLRELYLKTLNVLKRGLSNPVDKLEIIEHSKAVAMDMLEACSVSRQSVKHIWQNFGDDYFLRYQPDEICWQTQAVLKHHQLEIPLVVLRKETTRGCTEIFVYTKDSNSLFVATTTVIDNMGLNIVNARIITSQSGHTLDTFLVINEDGQPITEPFKLDEIRESLQKALENLGTLPVPMKRNTIRQLKSFENQIKVSADNTTKPGLTALSVSALDQPGLLSHLARCLADENLRVHDALINTLGERVEDIFFVTDEKRQPITSSAQLQRIQEHIQRKLESIQS